MTELLHQRTVELPKPAYANLFREPIFEPATEAEHGVDEGPRDEDEAH